MKTQFFICLYFFVSVVITVLVFTLVLCTLGVSRVVVTEVVVVLPPCILLVAPFAEPSVTVSSGEVPVLDATVSGVVVTVVDVSDKGGVAGAVLIDELESVIVDSEVVLSPQDAANKPIAKAKMLILIVFMVIMFSCYALIVMADTFIT